MPAGIIATGASLASNFGDVLSPIKSLFGGSSCSKSDVAKRNQIEEAVNKYLTASDMKRLVSGTESNVAPSPSAIARFFVGGRDCKHKNVSPGDQRLLDELPGLIQQRAQEAERKRQAYTPAVENGTPSLMSAGFNTSNMLSWLPLLLLIVLGGGWFLTQEAK